jgi:hypothetical protein
MFREKVVEKIETQILCSTMFFLSKNRAVCVNVEKYCKAGQATDDNVAHAHCMLDNKLQTHTQNM